jgi:hypothetical protein
MLGPRGLRRTARARAFEPKARMPDVYEVNIGLSCSSKIRPPGATLLSTRLQRLSPALQLPPLVSRERCNPQFNPLRSRWRSSRRTASFLEMQVLASLVTMGSSPSDEGIADSVRAMRKPTPRGRVGRFQGNCAGRLPAATSHMPADCRLAACTGGGGPDSRGIVLARTPATTAHRQTAVAGAAQTSAQFYLRRSCAPSG